MLRLVSDDHSRNPAYLVPFVLDRSGAPRFELRNRGTEHLRGLRLSLLGHGEILRGPTTDLPAEESLSFFVRGDDIARDCVLLVRWLRPCGDEYLWRASF